MRVTSKRMYAVLADNGHRLTDWYDDVRLMQSDENLVIVRKDGQENYLSLADGSLLLSDWADRVFPFNKNGFAVVKWGFGTGIVDKDGCCMEVDCYKFIDITAVVECCKLIPVCTENGLCGFLTDEGCFRNDLGLFHDYTPTFFDRNVLTVKKKRSGKGSTYVINLKTGSVSDGFDGVSVMGNNRMLVRKDGKFNVTDFDGRLLLKEWEPSMEEVNHEVYSKIG